MVTVSQMLVVAQCITCFVLHLQTEHDMFIPLQPRLICWQVVSCALHALVNVTAFFTELRHEGEE